MKINGLQLGSELTNCWMKVNMLLPSMDVGLKELSDISITGSGQILNQEKCCIINNIARYNSKNRSYMWGHSEVTITLTHCTNLNNLHWKTVSLKILRSLIAHILNFQSEHLNYYSSSNIL